MIVTAAALAIHLGKQLGGTYTAQVDQAIEAADTVIRSYCGQPVAEEPVTVRLSGDGSRTLLLPTWPVTLVASATLLSDAPTILAGDELHAESVGLLHRLNGQWPPGRFNIEVTYRSGHDPVPADVRLVALRLATRIFENPQDVASSSHEDVGTNWSFPARILTPDERQVLDRYRLPGVA